MRIAAAFVMGLLAVGLAQPAVADTDEDIPTWEYAEDDYAATAQIEPSEQDEYFRHDLPIRLSVRCSGSNLHARLSLTNPTACVGEAGRDVHTPQRAQYQCSRSHSAGVGEAFGSISI